MVVLRCTIYQIEAYALQTVLFIAGAANGARHAMHKLSRPTRPLPDWLWRCSRDHAETSAKRGSPSAQAGIQSNLPAREAK